VLPAKVIKIWETIEAYTGACPSSARKGKKYSEKRGRQKQATQGD
jgi:hypothetical protein